MWLLFYGSFRMKSMDTLQPKSVQIRKLRRLLNVTGDPILLIDWSGKIIEGNEATARRFGKTFRELVGKSIFDMIPHLPAFLDVKKIDEAKRLVKSLHYEIAENGQYFDVVLYPVTPENGSSEIAIYAHEVTELKHIEAKLRETERTYRNIYENATEGIFQIDPEGHYLSANPALAKIHGYDSPQEMLNAIDNVSKLYTDPSKRKELVILLLKYGHAENFETRMFRRDGSIVWISINAKVVRDDNGEKLYYEGTMQDITTRKEAEEALTESEEQYRTAVEKSNDGIAIIHKGKHLYVNQKWADMFEYSSPEEVIGADSSIIIHPDDLERITSINEQWRRGEPVPGRYEFRGVTKKGRVLYLDCSNTTMMYRGRQVSFTYLKDITERKRAEEALIESRNELERLNRAKSKAVNHISHELSTPLALVRANARLLRRKLQDCPQWDGIEKFLNLLERNVERLFEVSDEANEIMRASRDLETGGLTDDIDRLEQRMEGLAEVPEELRRHMRTIKEWIQHHHSGSHSKLQIIELYPFVESTVEKTRYLAKGRDLRITTENASRQIYILMDQEILREVLAALMKNAVENTPDGGSIRVKLEERRGLAWVDVIDTGVGINEENQAFVFDGLFHTTETDLYSSGRPYQFGAGGKGLDLLKLKVYAKTFGFELTMRSERCKHIPTDRDVCPGNIADCPFVKSSDECARSGGSVFSVGFRSSAGKALS